MTEWQPGQRVQAVDKERGADPIPGTVTELAGAYVQVEYDDPGIMAHTPSKRDCYYADSGWRAWDGEMRWRLEVMPVCTACGTPFAQAGGGCRECCECCETPWPDHMGSV